MLDPEKWVENHGDYLYTFIRYKVPSNEIAEDIVQETFLSALSSAKNFKGNSKERTWLISIAKRRIIDYYRKEARNKERNLSSYNLPFYEEGDNKGHWLENRAPKNWEPDSEINLDQFHQILHMCLSLLNPKQRLVFMMKIMDECSNEEVCAEVQISMPNLWTIMHRARLQIRECVEKKGYKNEN